MSEREKNDRQLQASIENAMRERSAIEAPAPGTQPPENIVTEDAWEAIEREWHDVVPKIRETFGALSEEELAATGGNYERFLSFVSERYQLTRREAEARVKRWLEQTAQPGSG